MNSRSQSLPVAGRHVGFLQGGWVDAADWICGPLAPCDVVDLVSTSSKPKSLLYQAMAAEDAVGGLGLDEMDALHGRCGGTYLLRHFSTSTL